MARRQASGWEALREDLGDGRYLLLLLATLALVAARVAQLLLPQRLPGALEVWVAGPWRHHIPIDFQPDVRWLALLPWMLYGLTQLAQQRLVEPGPRLGVLQVLALALTPGLNVAGACVLQARIAAGDAAPVGRRALRAAVLATLALHLGAALCVLLPESGWAAPARRPLALAAFGSELPMLALGAALLRPSRTPPGARASALPLLPGWACALLLGALVAGLGAAELQLRERLPCPAGTALHREPLPGGRVQWSCAAGAVAEGLVRTRDAQGRRLSEAEVTHGARTGRYREWDATGALRAERRYAQGAEVADGQGTCDETGVVWARVQHAQGLREGPFTYFLADKKQYLEGSFQEGLRHGEWVRYSAASDRVLAAARYERGRRVATLAPEQVRSDKAKARQAGVEGSAVSDVSDAEPVETLYAGHLAAWWEQRLRSLREAARTQEHEAQRYALTLERARRNGLQVEEGEPGPLRVTAAPGARTTGGEQCP